jgi:hypothetical protein
MSNPKDRVELTEDESDELAEKEHLEYLKKIGAIREDGTIDESKIQFYPAQTFEELEALLCQMKDNPTDG